MLLHNGLRTIFTDWISTHQVANLLPKVCLTVQMHGSEKKNQCKVSKWKTSSNVFWINWILKGWTKAWPSFFWGEILHTSPFPSHYFEHLQPWQHFLHSTKGSPTLGICDSHPELQDHQHRCSLEISKISFTCSHWIYWWHLTSLNIVKVSYVQKSSPFRYQILAVVS